MTKKKKDSRKPVGTIIHQITYERLLVYLRSRFVVKDINFEPDLLGLLKGLYYKYPYEFYAENAYANVIAFISQGLGFSHYLHPIRGKVVTDIFGPGELALNPNSFFNGEPADTGLEFIADTNILFLTTGDMDILFGDFQEVKTLTIKMLASMFKNNRAKDELHRLLGKLKIQQFFKLYPILLRSARQAPMKYKDIASYLNIDQYHFSTLMKELYPGL